MFSRKTKCCGLTSKAVTEPQTGIRWSEAVLEKYNELYDLVVKDRVARGVVFNNGLLNVFVECRRVRNAKPVREPDAKKH